MWKMKNKAFQGWTKEPFPKISLADTPLIIDSLWGTFGNEAETVFLAMTRLMKLHLQHYPGRIWSGMYFILICVYWQKSQYFAHADCTTVNKKNVTEREMLINWSKPFCCCFPPCIIQDNSNYEKASLLKQMFLQLRSKA